MDDSSSPLRLRRRLRTELLAARQKAGLTQQQVADAMEWSLSKMNRIEKAKSGITTNDLRALLRLYGITDNQRAEELLDLAREAKQRPWWRSYSDFASAELLELIEYQSASSAVSQFQANLVPGILQTEDYASAVLQAFYDENSTDERVAALVDLRTQRRRLLTSENAPRFYFVLDESVIHRPVGGPAVMSRQLQNLVATAELPNVTIRVIPFAAGLHLGMKGPFVVVQFDDAPDETIVFLEGQRGDFISDDPREAENFLEAFKRITAASLSPSDSTGLLLKAAGEMTLSAESPRSLRWARRTV
jgi:transcriptional regulator with XRE-family HTH domain